jgi:carbonic anhydrase/acetyltransferase-like protein (isoleucine patch superfamily)
LYMGSPAKRVRKLSEQERVSIGDYARNYVRYSRVYRGEHSYTENPFYRRDL